MLSRSLGGETGHRSGHRLLWVWNGTGFRRLADGFGNLAAQGQVTMGQHHQGHVAVQSSPEPAFVVVQPQLALGVLIEPFYGPPGVDQGHQVIKGEGVESPRKEVFGLSLVTCQGAFADKPPAGGEVLALLANPIPTAERNA